MTEPVAVGDLSSEEKGSGARRNLGKVELHQVPMHLLGGVARVLQCGESKYDKWNWAKGMAWSVCFDCAMRHLFKWWYGREEMDNETLEHHIDHAITNLLFLKHYLSYYPEGDDRPERFNISDINKRFDAEGFKERNNL